MDAAEPPARPQAPALRASDQDRDEATGRLQAAFAEGRLDDAECDRRGIRGAMVSRTHVRFVTHYGIDAADIQQALKVCGEVLAAG